MKRIIQLCYTVYALLIIGIVLLSFLPIGWCLAFLSKNKEGQWYRVGKFVLHLIQVLLGIKLTIKGTEHIPDEPVIFACNHQGFFDGIFFNFIHALPLVALTAPFPYFPGLFSFWLKKCGCIDVSRSFEEQAMYKQAHRREEVYTLLSEALWAGKNVLIFPEGHVERHPKILPFHWGAIRLAMNTGAPIVPATIEGSSKLFDSKKKIFTPAHITITLYKPYRLPSEEGIDLTVDIITQKTRQLENLIAHHLPISMRTSEATVYRPPQAKVITAFFDIDRTLFPGYTEVVIVKHLFRKGLLPLHLVPSVLSWYRQEKKGTLNHLEIIPRIAGLLKDRNATEMALIAQTVFEERIVPRIYQEAADIIRSHQQHGHRVVLVSEIFDVFLGPWAKYFDVDAAYGTRTEKKDGMLTGHIEGPIAYRKGKLHYAQEYLDLNDTSLEDSFAYGDSFGDAVLLTKVKYPYAVNPKPELKKIAKRHEIPLLAFSHEKER
ncbi:MAG: HAD-IB family hydrolase [bacterium]